MKKILLIIVMLACIAGYGQTGATNGRGGTGATTSNSFRTLTQKSSAELETATLGTELLSASGWTSVDWTGDWSTGWAHTTTATTTLSNTLAAVTNNYYQIAYTVTGRTTGSFTVAFGGQSKASIAATGTFGPKATSTANLVITPTTDFNGTIVISIKQITAVSSPIYTLYDNTGVSVVEMRSSSNAYGNQFIGKGVGRYNTTGINNTANGYQALYNNTTGYYNTANGYYALYSNTTGYYNTANGYQTLNSNTTGTHNTANGLQSLYSNTTGYQNTASGMFSLFSNTTGYSNTANGYGALYYNTTGYSNTANGYYALYSNTTGYYNTANGYGALYANTTGSNNIGYGYQAGRYTSDGATANDSTNNSIYIGYNAKSGAVTHTKNNTNETVIGYDAVGAGSNSVMLGNASVTTTVLRGSVGIGITAPATKLQVKDGAIRAGVTSYTEIDSTAVKAKAFTVTTTDTTSVGYSVGSIQMRITASDTSVWMLIRTTGSITARWKKLTP